MVAAEHISTPGEILNLVFHSKCNNARWGRPMAP